jgi:predicted DNA-binding transcriptional regulator AlpA
MNMSDDIGVAMKSLSTKQTAKKLGLDQANLQRWIRQKAVPFPPITYVGGVKVRLWDATAVARLKQALKKKGRKTK